MAFRHILSLYSLLAFAWFEGAQAFSTSSSRAATALPSAISLMTDEIYDVGMTKSQQSSIEKHMNTVTMASLARTRLQGSTQLAMATTDDSSDEDSSGENIEATTSKEQGSNETSKDAQKSNVILMFPLFCKFMVVLMIKFLTDMVVYPSLFLYRLVRRGKRKLLNLIGKIPIPGQTPATIKPNGTAKH